MNRRGFLKLSGVGALALAGGVALSEWLAGPRYRELLPPGAEPKILHARELAVLCAVCDRLLPDLSPSAREARVAERIDRELTFHGKKLQDDVRNALFLVEHGGWAHLSPSRFTSRAPAAQDAYLERMALGSSLERQALAGLREVVMFFYYCDERTWPQIHYDGPLVAIPSPPEADSGLIPKKERKT